MVVYTTHQGALGYHNGANIQAWLMEHAPERANHILSITPDQIVSRVEGSEGKWSMVINMRGTAPTEEVFSQYGILYDGDGGTRWFMETAHSQGELEHLQDKNFLEVLNSLSKEGWELVTARGADYIIRTRKEC